jgi:hypothetical protein
VVIAIASLSPAGRDEVEFARVAGHAIAMDKHELIAALRIGHDQLRAAIDALSDDELALPAQGEWTRRDVVAHIEWWERHSAHVITALHEGRDPYPADEPFDLDARNARIFEESRGRTTDDVRSGEAAAWADLLGAIEAAGETDLFDPARFAWTAGEPLVEIIHGDTDRHWAEHRPHLGPAGPEDVAGAATEAR